MYITAIEVQGFSDLPAFEATGLGRKVHVAGPTPATTALGDALELGLAGLAPAGLRRLLDRWLLLAPGEEPELLGEAVAEQAGWADRSVASSLVADHDQRVLRVRLEAVLDPTQFGRLREIAQRDPRLVAALSEGSTLQYTVSLLFAASWDVAALAVQDLCIGTERFSTAGKERPSWLDRFLADVATRFRRHDTAEPLAQAALSAATSRDGYEGYQRWRTALADHLGDVRPVLGPGGRTLLLAGDHPMRAFGDAGQHRASLAASVHLYGADILWAEDETGWLDAQVEGAGSPLEQVWRVGPSGTLRVEPDEPARRLEFRSPA